MVPAFAGHAGAVTATSCSQDHELLLSEFAHRQVADDDPVEPRLERAGRPEVVEREGYEDGVGGEYLAGELLGEGAGGGLRRGAVGGGDEFGGDGDVVQVRDRVDSQVAV